MIKAERQCRKSVEQLVIPVLLGLVCLSPSLPLHASTIFDNSVNSEGANIQNGSIELGDEIQLAGSARCLTNFSCGYILWTTDPQPDVTARIRFYLNDGADEFASGLPGTVLWDSDWFAIAPAYHGTLTLSAGSQLPVAGVFLPASDMTWSIQFQGLTSGTAGVRMFSPPVVGSDPPYCWANDGYGWFQTSPKPGQALDFEAVFEATEVPEPTPLALFILGAMVIRLRGLATRLHRTGRGASCL
jgi:hypothetical protein